MLQTSSGGFKGQRFAASHRQLGGDAFLTPLQGPAATLADLLKVGSPASKVLHITGGGLKLTRQELASRVDAVAAALVRTLGICNGDRVVLVMNNCLAYVVAILATVSIGAIAAPLDPTLSSAEFDYALSDLCPSVVILASGANKSTSAAITAAEAMGTPVAYATQSPEGHVTLSGSLNKSRRWILKDKIPRSRPDDPALALHIADGTAATAPRAIVLTHANLLSGALAAANAFALGPGDATLLSLPLFRIHALLDGLIVTLATGGTAVLPASGSFSGTEFWSDVAESGTTWISAVPTVFSLLLRQRGAWEAAGRPRMRLMSASCGSGAVPPDVRSGIEEMYGIPVVDAFAVLPSSMIIACEALPESLGSQTQDPSGGIRGTLLPGREVSIRAPDGTPVPPGKMGAIFIRGPSVSTAYVVQGHVVPRGEEWLNTTWQGWLDPSDSTLTAAYSPAGINQGGDKLYTGEVEAALEGFPGVDRVTAFALPHEQMGHVVAVALEGLAPGEEVFNSDICAYASTVGGLRGMWLPQCTVLVEGMLPEVPAGPPLPSPLALAAALGLPRMSGRTSTTYVHCTIDGKVQLRHVEEQSAEPKVKRSQRELSRSLSVMSRDNEALAAVEEAVAASFSLVLGIDRQEVTPDSNFFDLGGASLQVLEVLEKIAKRTGVNMGMSSVFLWPLVKTLAVHVHAEAQGGAAEGSTPKPLVAPPVTHIPESSPLRKGWQRASYSQEQMCVLDAQGFGAAYNMPWCVRLCGALDIPTLREALLVTVRNEEGLRTLARLNPTTMRAEQLVLDPSEAENAMEFTQLTAESFEQATAVVAAAQELLFDIGNSPVLRVKLVKVSSLEHLLLVDTHHVNSDTWTVVEHRKQVLSLYVTLRASALGGIPPREPLLARHPITYLDFSLWQRKWLQDSHGADSQLAYWLTELADPPLLDMPFDHPRPLGPLSEQGGKVEISISPELAAQWRRQLTSRGCTLFMGAISLYHVLLSRWTGQDDIITGAATANRNAHPALARVLGYFANIVAVRSDLRGRLTYAEVLEQVRGKLLAAWSAQDVPFHEVVAALAIPRVPGATPIFQAMFALQEASWHTIDGNLCSASENLTAEIVRVDTHKSKFWVHLMLRERADGGIDGDLLYPTDLFDAATMERMGRHFETLVQSITDHPSDLPFAALTMLPEAELRQVAQEWNRSAPSPPFPTPQRIEEQVNAAARRLPNAVAVEEAGGRTLTYGELAQQSASVAATLAAAGCTPGDVVALAFLKEVEMVVAQVGVLAAGCVLMPIDVENTPVARIGLMLEDGRPRVFLHQERYSGLDGDLKLSFAVRFIPWAEVSTATPRTTAPHATDASALFGLFYTSGSTGPPKGVMVSHANVHNLVHWWSRLVALNPADKSLLFSSPSFIMSLRQMWPTLCMGAVLVLPASSLDFGEAISKCGVTKVALTPSALATIDPAAAESLKVVQVAGEAPTLALSKAWASRLEAFYIGLGPTELTAHACNGQFLASDEQVTIGMPVPNAAVYCLNAEGQIQPSGVAGELWIAGENVSQGYLNKPDLSAAQFVVNPWDATKPRAYRTGDHARRLVDGRVQFIGRKDAQVKIRGFRVELREIVDVILELGTTLERAEVAMMGNSLVAFVMPKMTGAAKEALRQGLARRLPPYMIPNRIVSLSEFPLNKNGKLDRPALAEAAEADAAMDAGGSGGSKQVPSTPLEHLVSAAWADVLNCSTDDLFLGSNFFEQGGTSLAAILVTRILGTNLGCAIPVATLFSNQTLGELAAALADNRGEDVADVISIVKAPMEPQGRPLPRPLFSLLQVLGVLAVLLAGLGPAGCCVAMCLWLVLGPLGFVSIPLFPLIWMVGTAAHVFAVLLLKHGLLGGRLRPGVYPLFSPTFLRWWLMRKMISITRTWTWYLQQTPVILGVYRVLGATIGAAVTLDDAVLEDPDLITIGEGAMLQPFATLTPGEILGDMLVLRAVSVGPGAKMEPRAAILGGGVLGAACTLRPAAAVTASSPNVQSHIMEGSPALPAEKFASPDGALPVWRPRYTCTPAFLSGQVLGAYFNVLLTTCAFSTSLAIARIIAVDVGGFQSGVFCFVAFFLPLFLAIILATVAAKWLLVGRVRPGRRDGAWFGLRMWVVDRLLMSPILRMATYVWLQEGTTYPVYLRALGASVGSDIWWNRPLVRTGVDLLTVGSHLHAGQMEVLLSAKEDGSGVEFLHVTIGDHCTLGQRVVMMPGGSLGDGVTVGAEGVIYPGQTVPVGCTVFGCPPTVFKSTADDVQQVAQLQAQVDIEEGRKSANGDSPPPQAAQACTPRLVIALSMVVNVLLYPALSSVYGVFYLVIVDIPLRDTISNNPWWLTLLVPAVYLAGTAFLTVLVAVATRSGIASFRAGSTPFYSWRFFTWWLFTWVNDIVSGPLLYPLAGTWAYQAWLRLMGARIGAAAFVAPHGGGFREIDHLEVGTGAVVLTPSVQSHFIDHDALQFAPCRVDGAARVNVGATVMPLCRVGAGATVRGVATTLKGQELAPGGRFIGSPAAADAERVV